MNQTISGAIGLPWSAAVTLLALLLHLATTAIVGRARRRYGVRAPAVTGNEHFERAYRVQMNTIEQMMFFLPALWLCAVFLSDPAAAVAGLVWVTARALYAAAYLTEPVSRAPWVVVSMLAQGALFLGAAAGVVRAVIA